MQHCPSCGHEQAPDTRCGACGEWLGEPEAAESSPGWGSPPPPEADPPPPAFEPEPMEQFERVAEEHVAMDGPSDVPVFDVEGPAAPSARVAAMGAPSRSSANSAVTFALLGGAFMLALVVVIVIANRSGPSGNPDDPKPDAPTVASEPPEIIRLRRAELDALRDAAADIERNDTTEPVIDSVNALYSVLRAHWSAHDWSAVDRDLAQLEPKLKDLQRIDKEQKETAVARAAAERTRDNVAESRGRAEQAGAIELAPKLWASANKTEKAAVEQYQARDYPEAQAEWQRAMSDYEAANSLASAGVTARRVRERVDKRATRRFTREQLEAHGSDDWKDVTAALAEGDAAYKLTEYAEAISFYEQAGDAIEPAERSVQRELGVKFYAVSAGYLAATILLEHASGQYLDADGRRSLVDAYRAIGLPAAALAKVPQPNADKLAYRLLGNTLALQLRDAIRDARGVEVQRAYNIGFQLRLVQKLLGDDADNEVTQAHRTEVGKSILLVKREVKAAGFVDDLADELEAIRKALLGPDDGFVEVRTRWMTLVGRFSRYETAIKIVGEAAPKP